MKLIYKCKLCDKQVSTLKALGEHINMAHQIKPKEYYDKFIAQEGEGFCQKCGKPLSFQGLNVGYRKICQACSVAIPKENETNQKLEKVCEECGFTIHGTSERILMIRFSKHVILNHNMTAQQYYDKHIKKPGEGLCKNCGKPTSFIGLMKGYREYCVDCKLIAGNIIKNELIDSEHKFQEELQLEKEKQEEIIKNREEQEKEYIQYLKNEAHKYDWEGERNTWLCRETPVSISNKDKDNLLTDNSVSYIEGQKYDKMDESLKDNEEIDFTNQFWL